MCIQEEEFGRVGSSRISERVAFSHSFAGIGEHLKRMRVQNKTFRERTPRLTV